MQGEVIRSRSTQCMVFPLSLGNFVCALLWVMYGSLRGDLYVKVRKSGTKSILMDCITSKTGLDINCVNHLAVRQV
jgi:hypothetical protein